MSGRRWKVALGLVAATALGVFVYRHHLRRSESDAARAVALPLLSPSPHANVAPEAQYIGIAACKACHASNFNSYLHTSHSRALSDVDPAAEPPDGGFEHPESGRSYRVYRSKNELRHVEEMRTRDGRAIAKLDLPMRCLVGSGHFSRTYLAEVDGFLSESPITWYAQKKSWALSPGYDVPAHPGFGRAVTAECLFCHAGRVESTPAQDHRAFVREQPIGCESCHGPGSLHEGFQRSGKHSPGRDDLTIVNPGKLPRDRLESVCAVCHLQGVAGIDVRGRNVQDFRPGMPLSDYRVHYLFAGQSEQMKVVGHFEQLRQSRCYQKSEELSCLTCHNPHLRETPKDTIGFYRQKCLSCHETHGCSLAKSERLRKEPADNCSACHMPRADTDIPHIAFTHHRIGRWPSPNQPTGEEPPLLVPFEEGATLSRLDRDRNLGLAYVIAAARATDRRQSIFYLDRGQELLERVRDAGFGDAGTLVGLATTSWQNKDLSKAGALARSALGAADISTEGRFQALEVLLEAHLTDGAMGEAAGVLEKLTKLRRFSEDWRLLGTCYLKLDRPQEARAALEKALAINPFREQTYAALADACRRLGDGAKADNYQEKARLLAERRPP